MSVTRTSLESDFAAAMADALGAGVGPTDLLSDAEQAIALNAVMEAMQYHCDTVNPDVKPTPHIKFKT